MESTDNFTYPVYGSAYHLIWSASRSAAPQLVFYPKALFSTHIHHRNLRRNPSVGSSINVTVRR